MIHQVYDNGFLGLLDGDIDWVTGPVTAVLLSSAYTPNISTHSTYADLTNEITDPDYAPVAIGSRAINLDGANVDYDGGNAEFGDPVTITARYMVFVAGTAGALAGTDRLISLHDIESDASSTNAVWRITAPAAGWFSVSRAA